MGPVQASQGLKFCKSVTGLAQPCLPDSHLYTILHL